MRLPGDAWHRPNTVRLRLPGISRGYSKCGPFDMQTGIKLKPLDMPNTPVRTVLGIAHTSSLQIDQKSAAAAGFLANDSFLMCTALGLMNQIEKSYYGGGVVLAILRL